MYDENSIRVLDVTAQRERFSFAAATALADDYPSVPVEAIHRLLTAAMISGTSREAVVERYLKGDKTLAMPPEFHAAYAELIDDARRAMEKRR